MNHCHHCPYNDRREGRGVFVIKSKKHPAVPYFTGVIATRAAWYPMWTAHQVVAKKFPYKKDVQKALDKYFTADLRRTIQIVRIVPRRPRKR